MIPICRKEVIEPGGIELTQEAERHLDINRDTVLLSVGCGTGELECYLAKKYGCNIIGIDPSERFILKARKKAVIQGLESLVQFEIGDGNSIRFDREIFDVVFCCGALYQFYDNGLAEFHMFIRTFSTRRFQCLRLTQDK